MVSKRVRNTHPLHPGNIPYRRGDIDGPRRPSQPKDAAAPMYLVDCHELPQERRDNLIDARFTLNPGQRFRLGRLLIYEAATGGPDRDDPYPAAMKARDWAQADSVVRATFAALGGDPAFFA